MSNPRNNGTLVGRLAQDPKVWENKDGSRKVVFTVFADRNYTTANNERPSDALPVEVFVNKDVDHTKTPYARIHKGDLVALGTTLRMDSYEKNGSRVFEVKIVAEDITFLESRQVTQDRLAQRVAEAEAVNQAARAAAPAPVAQPQAAAPVAVPATAVEVAEQLPFG